MKYFQKMKEHFIECKLVMATILTTLFYSVTSNAALPTAVDPSTGAAGGNFVTWFQGWFGDSAETVALMLSTAGFVAAAWILLSKFYETKSSKEPDWGSFGLTGAVAGVVMVACTYLLTEATAVI